MYLDYSALEKSQGTVCYSSIMLDDIANTVSGHSTPHTQELLIQLHLQCQSVKVHITVS